MSCKIILKRIKTCDKIILFIHLKITNIINHFHSTATNNCIMSKVKIVFLYILRVNVTMTKLYCKYLKTCFHTGRFI